MWITFWIQLVITYKHAYEQMCELCLISISSNLWTCPLTRLNIAQVKQCSWTKLNSSLFINMFSCKSEKQIVRKIGKKNTENVLMNRQRNRVGLINSNYFSLDTSIVHSIAHGITSLSGYYNNQDGYVYSYKKDPLSWHSLILPK